MPASSQFVAFAAAAGANVESPTVWAADSAIINGFSSGILASNKLNTALRQPAFVAAAFAQWLATQGSQAVNDDGTLANFIANINAGMAGYLAAQGYATSTGTALTYAPLASPALTGSPTAPTQSQFDNSTKLATTAFVQRQVGNFAGYTSLSGAQTIGASKAGFYLSNSTAGTAAWTLPNATINAGYCICIENAGTGVLTLTSGGGNFTGPLGNTSTSLAIAVGQTIEMVADGAAWHCYAGTAGLALSSVFANSLSASGYQYLPSGLILQWATYSGTVGTGASYSFPISFPTAALFASGNYADLTAINNGTSNLNVTSISTSGFSTTWSNAYNSGGSPDTASIRVIAIGK